MIINDHALQGILICEPTVYEDERGYFFESFNEHLNHRLGVNFVQDSHSVSHHGVVRGMHYQWTEPMGKLVRVAAGSIIDYFVDIRKGSPTFGQYGSLLLSEENRKSVWIPPGFAHGFESLENNTVVLYKQSSLYNREGEGSLNPFDANVGIEWKIPRKEALLSEKDLNGPSLIQYAKDSKF